MTSIFRSASVSLLAAVAVLVFANQAWSQTGNSLPPKCQGNNILPTLERDNPEAYARIRAAGDTIPNANAMLWKIEKAGLPPSHLLGTMHASDPRLTTLDTPTKAALADAKVIALELADFTPDSMAKAFASQPELLFYTDTTRLDDKLSGDEFARLTDILTKQGTPPAMIAAVRPWMAYLSMALPACEQKRIQAGATVFDAVIGNYGKKHTIPVIGLETPLQQIRSLANIAEDDQINLLKTAIAMADRQEDLLETLVQAYLARKINLIMPLSDELARMRNITDTGSEAFVEAAIRKRNLHMRSASLPLLGKGNAFIAVGALHLVGKTGLVALFRKAGYTLTPVS